MRPTEESADRGLHTILLAAAVVLTSLNLRPAITSVGPMLDRIRDDVGASASWAGLLTTVPVLCFAAGGLVAPVLARRLGLRTAIGTAVAAVAVGLVLRVLGGAATVIGATVVATGGIALIGALMPVVVRRSFPRSIGLVTGVYTAALQGGAVAGFALTPVLADALDGWRAALGVWSVLAVAALVVWWTVTPRAPGLHETSVASSTGRSGGSLLRNRLAWTVTVFFGLQAFVAFAVMGWLPQVLMSAGMTRGDAGLVMGLLTLIAVPVSLTVPALATRGGSQSGWIVALSLCGLAGGVGFLAVPDAAPLVWASLLGTGMSVFSLALTTIALRARTADDTVRLSGMAQGIGYLVAATGPFLFGVLHDVTGGWRLPFTLLVGVLVAQTVLGALAGRPRHV